MKTTYLTRFSLLFILGLSNVNAASSYSEGSWISDETSGKATPAFRVDVDAPKRKVSLTFIEGTKVQPPSIGITFFDSFGTRTLVKLRAMDLSQVPARYEGTLTRSQSFVGFEVEIPIRRKKPAIIPSHQLNKMKDRP